MTNNTFTQEDFVLYEGYKVFRDGSIVSSSGKKISAYNLTHKGSHVKLIIGGKTVVKNKAVLVYSCFCGEPVNTYQQVIQFKNNDYEDTSFDNLYLVDKKEYIKNLDMKGKSRFTDDEKERIRKEYRRLKKKGQASIRSFAIRYDCSYITMKKVLKSVL